MPSKKILEGKQQIVADLVDQLKKAKSGVLVKYQGITVEDDTALRAKMRGAGVSYVVMKNSLSDRAFDAAGLEGMKPHLVGMNSLAISPEDPIAPAKILKEYADKIESFEIRAGFLEGAVIDANAVCALAEIPSRETLIARMLGSMQSSLYGLVYALQAIIDSSDQAVAQ